MAVEAISGALKAFRFIDLNPVAFIASIWDERFNDVPDLNHAVSESIHMDLEDLQVNPSLRPLGCVYLGAAGTGKTHMLGRLRRTAQTLGGQFVLVDLTGVDHFLRTTALHFLQSLLKDANNSDFPGKTQLDLVLGAVYARVKGIDSLSKAKVPGWGRDWKPGELHDFLSKFTTTDQDAPDSNQLRAVLRALFALRCGDEELAELAHSWLQGVELESGEANRIGLPQRMDLIELIKSECFFMSLRGPTLVAFDQLDGIVTYKELASKADAEKAASEAALAVVYGIANGLADVCNSARRTLVVVSCLEQSWTALQRTPGPNWQRFRDPRKLENIQSSQIAMKMVEQRLRPAYLQAGFQPPYPTYPFKSEFFSNGGLRPRQLLAKCLEHIRSCREKKDVTELATFDGAPTIAVSVDSAEVHYLDEAFSRAKNDVDSAGMLMAGDEDRLGTVAADLCELIVRELPPLFVDVNIERDSPRKGKFPSLHARLRVIFREEGDRELHFCLRVLQATNANSFLARARAAITEAGIDLRLPFRNLTFLRNEKLPAGKKCQELVNDLKERGGHVSEVSQSDLATVLALSELERRKDSDFDRWIRQRRPLSALPLVRRVFAEYLDICNRGVEHYESDVPQRGSEVGAPTPKAPSATGGTLADVRECQVVPLPAPHGAPSIGAAPAPSSNLIIGRQTGSLATAELVTLPVTALSRHVVIRAGSGSGKTVLLKRLVEEAALSGVPSIVIDGANDLVFLGDRVASPPAGWLPGDSERAKRYHSKVEVRVWTPGLNAGHPLRFPALPDFSCLIATNQSADELDQAVSMAVGSLSEVAGLEGGMSARLKQAVLKETLLYFARRGGRTLKELAEVLDQLPPEAGAGIKDAAKLSGQIADRIRASIVTDRLLAADGKGHDPGDLFRSANGLTRVSIISLEGLTEEERPRLVDQLAITLFGWIKKFPPSGASRMNGLLVLDEAQEFLPSVRSTSCKQSLMRLAVQARKYGLGLMVATQNPKNLDYNAVSQFSTHFYGKAAAPQAIDVIRKAIEDRGGHASDIANLEKGTFYFTSSEGWSNPIRIKAPMCLSHHPDQQTATEQQILDRALQRDQR